MKNLSNNADNTLRLLLDAREAAQALSICERTLRELVRRGEIAAVRIGRRCIRYPVAALQGWIAKRASTDNQH